MTPVPRQDYRIGVPRGGWWQEVLEYRFGVLWRVRRGNSGGIQTTPVPSHGERSRFDYCCPRCATLLLRAGS